MGFRVFKVNPADMSQVDVFDGIYSGTQDEHVLISDGTYLYAGKNYFGGENGLVVQIDPSDMSYVDAWDEASRNITALDFDGTYVLAAVDSGEYHAIVRIDPATMTEVDRWLQDVYDDTIIGITHDASYYYAVINRTPGIIFRIDPATMTTVDTFNTVNTPGEVKCVGGYLYVVGTLVLSKIDTTTMTEVDSWTNDTGNIANTLDVSTFIYAGILSEPGQVAQIGPTLGRSYGFIID